MMPPAALMGWKTSAYDLDVGRGRQAYGFGDRDGFFTGFEEGGDFDEELLQGGGWEL